MDKRSMGPIVRYLSALVCLMVTGLGAGPLRPAGAAQEDCRPDGEARAYHCMWDQEDFQGNMKAIGPTQPVELAGQCVNYSIRSAANNGKSGFATLYLYEQASCAGDSTAQLNAGESIRSVTARSGRFGPKGAYR